MTTPYNLTNIRALLTEGFTAADLRTSATTIPTSGPFTSNWQKTPWGE
jgi:hypothetical protein